MKQLKRVYSLIVVFLFLSNLATIAQNKIEYCNSVQNRDGFIRYPLGSIGVWSTEMGEIASVMTRVPRIYPCLDSVVVRHLSDQWRFVEEEWRDSLSGDPSTMVVNYKPDKPCGASTAAMTVAQHVSTFKISFPEGAKKKFIVLDFARPKVDPWAKLNNWTERIITRIDDKTIQATVAEPGKKGAFYVIRFSETCAHAGMIIDTSNTILEGATKVVGAEVGMYAQFDVPSVTVAVAESFTSMEQAKEYLASEFSDFKTVRRHCLNAWNEVLKQVEIEGSETSKRMVYTALYTLYANIINGSDGSVYSKYYSKPISLSSSDYWQFIGGFHSCAWDNYRTAYPFLMLGYPDVAKDIVNMYLARYQRDGIMGGNICLYTGPMEGNTNARITPVLISQMLQNGIPADYKKLYAALKDNFSNDEMFPSSISKLGFVTQPLTGGKACSYTLEFSTSLHSMALLAKENGDVTSMRNYAKLSKSYVNVWDSTEMVFRLRNEDRTWGPISHKEWTWNPNPWGLFEGTTDDWMFAVPHDPYGLINLPGQKNLVNRIVNYCLTDCWFNDYQYQYPFLLYYAGAANTAQKILRESWVPLFNDAVMYEEVTPKLPHHTYHSHYTSNAGWLLCTMTGLFPMPAPEGQYIITSPSIDKAVIHHGDKNITIQTKNNSEKNIYIHSIQVDGKPYPCYMIPAKRLIKGINIDLEMGSDSTQGLGDLYISSTDGYVQNVELVSAVHLKCTIDAAIEDATTKIYSRTKPVKVLVNGEKHGKWSYDKATMTSTIQTNGTAILEALTR